MNRSVLSLGVGALILMGAGCSFGGSSKAISTVDGGVFKTANLTEWAQLNVLNQGPKLGSIGNVGTTTGVFDPQDPTVMYVGTAQNGLLMSLDAGASWQQARGLTTGAVASIAVHPREKCTVFVAKANQLLKTDTCGRDWAQIYFDPRTAQQYTSIVIDPVNPKTLYAGNVDGDILRSEDEGTSWRVLHRAESRVNAITIDPRDTNVLYVATNGSGVLKTVDRGVSWQEIRAELDAYEGARRPLMILLDPTKSTTIYHVSRNGVLRSDDAGGSFRALALPTPSQQTNIRAFAIHPRMTNTLVYATDTSVVSTQDGGQTWTPKKLPTTRSASFLLFDNNPTQTSLYLGTIPR